METEITPTLHSEAKGLNSASYNGNGVKFKMSRSQMFTKNGNEYLKEDEAINDHEQENGKPNLKISIEYPLRFKTLPCNNDLAERQNECNALQINQTLTKRSKVSKRQTYNFDNTNQQMDNKNSSDGFNTARSVIQQSSLSRLNSKYIEASIRKEEQILKRIEEKALMLKKKQKKEREMLKHLKKNKEQCPINSPTNSYSLAVIGPDKPKPTHRRGESYDFPIPENHEVNSSCLQSMEIITSDNQQKASNLESMILKEGDEKIKLSLLQETIDLLRQENTKKQAENKELNQILLKQKEQINQLNITISSQTIKLQQISKKNDELVESLKYQEQRFRVKQNQRQQLQKAVGQLAQDKRKQEQLLTKQIQKIKNTLQSIKNEHQLKEKLFASESENYKAKIKVLKDEISKKQTQISNRGKLQEETQNKYRKQFENTLVSLKEQISKLKLEHARLTTSNQEKVKEINNMCSFLRNAQDHIKKIEGKYYETSKELTEKNVSFDFLWIQLKEEERKRKIIEEEMTKLKQTKQEQLHNSLLQSSENDSPMKQEDNERSLQHVLSSSTLKDMKDLRGLIQQGQSHNNGESRNKAKQSPINLPLSHQCSLTFNNQAISSSKILTGSLSNIAENPQPMSEIQKIAEEKEIELDILQPTTPNIFLKTELSDAMSQSEQNDEINELVSNSNSNTSKMESSVGAFSEYSRIKSTKSEMTYKEVEDEYRSKMKNSKIWAKLGKFKGKK